MPKIYVIDQNTGNLVQVNNPSAPASPIVGQIKIAVTGTAVQFPDHELSEGVVTVYNHGDNVVVIGGSDVENTADGSGNGFAIPAGELRVFSVSELSALYVNGTNPDWISYAAS
jgi:hypothetical protein